MMQIRQGDVLVQYVDAIPSDGLKPVARGERGLVLAWGEVTGHAHALLDTESEMFEDRDGTLWLKMPAPTELRHTKPGNVASMDHDTVALPPGFARVVRQYEATALDEPRMVAD